jgi:hypothetical protein
MPSTGDQLVSSPVPHPRFGWHLTTEQPGPCAGTPWADLYVNEDPHPLPLFATERIALAQADLDVVNATDLIGARTDEVILIVERLRGSLADTLRLLRPVGPPSGCQQELDAAEGVNLALAGHLALAHLANRLRCALAEALADARAAQAQAN